VPALDPDQITRNIGRRIAELRRERGLTQEQFSVGLRASFQWVSQVESGTRNMTIHSLVKVANALGVEIESLFKVPEARPVLRGRPPRSPKKAEEPV